MKMLPRPIVLLIAVGLFLAGCGEAYDGPDDASTGDDPSGPDAVTLAVADSPLGTHLVDGEGLTLYLFEADEPGVSSCTGGCLDNWPPVTVDGDPVLGDGVAPTLVGTFERADDGSTQVTYDGLPLYRWAGDGMPGDVEGQGINDVWWVVAPDGTAITDVPEDAESEDGGSSY